MCTKHRHVLHKLVLPIYTPQSPKCPAKIVPNSGCGVMRSARGNRRVELSQRARLTKSQGITKANMFRVWQQHAPPYRTKRVETYCYVPQAVGLCCGLPGRYISITTVTVTSDGRPREKNPFVLYDNHSLCGIYFSGTHSL